MGNFYTNIVLSDTNVDTVASLLEMLGRRAYAASQGKVTVVYDERCDEQDLAELEQLAGTLSAKLNCTAIAFCNHDDDVLWYALVEQGKVTDRYNSRPGYFDGAPGGDRPEGGDALRLCTAFGAAARYQEVEQLLRGTRSAGGLEIDRHVKLLEHLDLPPSLAILGYGYVGGGELAGSAPGAVLRTVGGAPDPTNDSPNEQRPARTSGGESPAQAETFEIMRHGAALAFAEVDIPRKFSRLLGRGRINGYTALLRLQYYIVANKLSPHAGMTIIYADDSLAELLGQRKIEYISLARLLARALGVAPLSAADEAALRSGDAAFTKRFLDAARKATEEM
jgi:hypothetical protein